MLNINAAKAVTALFDLIGLQSVVSRKTHGVAGTFDLTIDNAAAIGGAVTVEPRAIGAGHRIVFQFSGLVTSAGSVAVVDQLGAAIGSASVQAVGNTVEVTLTGIADNRRARVTLAGVNGIVAAEASMGFLVGDANNTRSVNSSDISSVKARSGQTANVSNFRFDVNTTGAINSADISVVKARSGLVLP